MEPTTATRLIETALISLVRRTSDPRGNDYLAERAGVDLERSAWTLLSQLAECQPARLGDVAEVCGLDISTVSRQVGALVAAGLITQSADNTDRRAKVHTLTDAGAEALSKIRKARWDWLNEVLDDFDASDREQFADLLSRFVAAMANQRDIGQSEDSPRALT